MLEGARAVAYAYSVGTDVDGTSGVSPWTDWIELKEVDAQVQYPVLNIGDSKYNGPTIRKVYHRVLKQDGELPKGGPPPVAEQELEQYLAEIFKGEGPKAWVDTKPA